MTRTRVSAVRKHVTKSWGEEVWHYNDGDYCMKELNIVRGAASSMHVHPIKKETFLVVEGVVVLEFPFGQGLEMHEMHPGDSHTIMPRQPHRFFCLTPTAKVVEASTHHDDADVVRLEGSRQIKFPVEEP